MTNSGALIRAVICPREDTRRAWDAAVGLEPPRKGRIMGLTIHWSLKSRGSRQRVQDKIEQLRAACLDLPFESVGGIVCLRGLELQRARDDRDHPLSWTLIQAGQSVVVDKTGGWTRYQDVPPDELICFSTWPGEGCEEANFFLGRYAASVEYHGRSIPTDLSGWCGRSFCKTQYASNVSVPHFLRCHLAVCAALEKAKALKLVKTVHDEGDYWTKRDVAALAREVGEWNEMIAGIAGALSDATGGGSISPITDHPQFKRLEHVGLQNPTTATAAKIMAEIAQKLRPPPPAA